jgi:serine/threonine-protein kinase
MNITDPFVLPKDVVLTKVKSLPKEERRQFEADDDDLVLTRVRSRSQSKIVDAGMAKLIQEFREAKTIVDAVVAYSKDNGRDPDEILEAAYPILERLISSNILVPEGSDEAKPVEASLKVGDHWDRLHVIRITQLLEDSEIYQARTAEGQLAALKIARPEAAERLASVMSREAAILKHLDGTVAPRCIQAGTFRDRPYVVTEWCDGLNGARAAARLRSIPGREGRRNILDFCIAIAEAYAELHRQSVVHGDVHPGNLIIGDEGTVRIIDFGLGRLITSNDKRASRARRGGVGFFFEPEYAQAWAKDRQNLPLASYAGEQHILAHLLYRLVTGHGFVDFSAELETAMKQLAEGKPEPFPRWGAAAWPDLEQTLGRALSIDPNERFESVAEFATTLREAAIPDTAAPEPIRPRPITSLFSDRLVADYLRRFDPAGALFDSEFPQIPRCSLTFGGGGVAYFLYRLACMREDARLLSWAKLWIEKAVADAGRAGNRAFYDPHGDLRYEVIGTISLYHTMSGLRAVQALIGKAMGDIPAQLDALAAFADSVRMPCKNIDVTLGKSGALVGCALLVEAFAEQEMLRDLGEAFVKDIWTEIEAKPQIEEEKEFRFTGIAHGWAGVLYAILAWCRATGRPLPDTLADRLDQLADLAESSGRGVRWQRKVRPPKRRDPKDYFLSWCNGTGGMIFLWTLAHKMLDEKRYLGLAEGAAWNVVENSDGGNQICCGRPGQAFGILNLYKHTQEERWLGFAKQMTEESLSLTASLVAHQAPPPYYYSLYNGPLGSALLSNDMTTAPDRACMPLFETEGWQVFSGAT